MSRVKGRERKAEERDREAKKVNFGIKINVGGSKKKDRYTKLSQMCSAESRKDKF